MTDAPTVTIPAVTDQPADPESVIRAEHIMRTVEIATAVKDAAVAELAAQLDANDRLIAVNDTLRRDRDALLTANLGLQDALDAAAVRETALQAEAGSSAAHVRELLEERRRWLWHKARLEAANAELRRPAEVEDSRPKGRRRRPR